MTSLKKLRLATRGSPLALCQAKMVEAYLKNKLGDDVEFEIVVIKTTGDKRQDWSLEKHGGKGLFTKEIEDALSANEVDLAIHSAKDLPSETPDDLTIVGCLPRDASRDVLAIRENVAVPTLIASGSPRRRSQLKKVFPQAVWTELRGNVETRLKKIINGQADATVLSEAGLLRLGYDSFEGIIFKPIKKEICVPAVGQGLIAIECRCSDADVFEPLFDSNAKETLMLEREFLTTLGGGCQVAYAAHCEVDEFCFYHENTGFQKISFQPESNFNERITIVKEIATGING